MTSYPSANYGWSGAQVIVVLISRSLFIDPTPCDSLAETDELEIPVQECIRSSSSKDEQWTDFKAPL